MTLLENKKQEKILAEYAQMKKAAYSQKNSFYI
jgi:hypothetical protein